MTKEKTGTETTRSKVVAEHSREMNPFGDSGSALDHIDAKMDSAGNVQLSTDFGGEASVMDHEVAPLETKEYELPLALLYGEDEHTSIKNFQLFAQYPFFTITEERAIRKYLIIQKLTNGNSLTVSITMVPGGNTALPTIADADLLVFVISLIRRRISDGTIPQDWIRNRTVKIKVSDFFKFIGASRGGKQHDSLEKTLKRLASSRIEFKQELSGPATTSTPDYAMHLKNDSIISSFEIKMLKSKDGDKALPSSYVVIEFSKWFWDMLDREKSLLTYDDDYVCLSPFKKALYSKIKKSLGYQPIFRIKLITLAYRLGLVMTTSNDRKTDIKDQRTTLYRLRKYIRDVIADNDLLEICVAMERPKTDGEEIVVFYQRNWRQRLSTVINPKTGRFYTELELTLTKLQGHQDYLFWFFNELITTDKIRIERKDDANFQKRMARDAEILKKGKTGQRMTKGETRRFKLLKRLAEMEKPAPYKDPKTASGVVSAEDYIEPPVLG